MFGKVNSEGGFVKRTTIVFTALAVVLSATVALAFRATPVNAIKESEMSAGFSVKFDRLPSKAPIDFGPFSVSADAAGHVSITYFAVPTDIAGDFTCATRSVVKKGEWHHIETSYSMQKRRVALYMDGAFEYENDRQFIPVLRGGAVVAPSGGNVRDLLVYPCELESERLIPVGDGSRDTVADVRDRKRDAAKREVFKGIAGPAAIYVVPPYSQEMFLPYDLPRRGKLGGDLEVFACADQQVAGSLLVFALKAPLKIQGAKTTDLRTSSGAVLPKEAIDVKIVKRWYRAGGAWLTYHGDNRQRILTPDLLMYDDAAIKVDEVLMRNYIRLDCPEGTRYVDVSSPDVDNERWSGRVPFHDARVLQPLEIPEWGRNQQFLVTFTVPKGQKPGIYTGSLELVGAGSVKVVLEVLPIDLPEQGAPYYDTGKSYISLNNSFPSALGPTLEARRECALETMKQIRTHGMYHTSNMWDTPEHVRLAREAGFSDPDRLFSEFTGDVPDWRGLYPGRDQATLSLADKAKAERYIMRGLEAPLAYRRETFAKRPEDFILFYSETGSFGTLVKAQEGRAEMARKAGYTVYSHIMNDDIVKINGDVVDGTATTTVIGKYARIWNDAGGELINYATPFPSSENPEYFRRRVGILMYKKGFSGDMLHECYREYWPFHEFCGVNPEIGGYRNFEMCIPTQDRFIWKLAYDGMREAMNDVRYFTALRRLANKYRDSEDETLRREARRQLVWLASVDEESVDLDMLRTAVASRIMILQNLAAKGQAQTR